MHCAPAFRAGPPPLFQRFRTALIQRHIRLGRQHHVGAFEHRAFILVAEQMHFGVYARARRPRARRAKSPLSEPRSATARGLPVIGLL